MSGHAIETCLQPENCVPIKPWKAEADDTVLLDLIPFLERKHLSIIAKKYLDRSRCSVLIVSLLNAKINELAWFNADVSRAEPADIRPVLESYKGCDIPSEFIARSKDHKR